MTSEMRTTTISGGNQSDDASRDNNGSAEDTGNDNTRSELRGGGGGGSGAKEAPIAPDTASMSQQDMDRICRSKQSIPSYLRSVCQTYNSDNPLTSSNRHQHHNRHNRHRYQQDNNEKNPSSEVEVETSIIRRNQELI